MMRSAGDQAVISGRRAALPSDRERQKRASGGDGHPMPHETGFKGRKTSADYAVKGVTSPALGGSIMMSRLMAMDVTSRGVRSCAAHTMKNEIAKR
ncbi:MAG: hypothetical protein CME84_01365 [Henriciella sp.]|jgi:hypothetical protein|nr:hypothetical protein [Henriciella sp.]MBF35035.1 hypothetical protein [Hyphomonadaceae bacterium]|tara:strand:- start:97 stop:384 length:288 start_codon:yes stop_codon:yes gene_type:complete